MRASKSAVYSTWLKVLADQVSKRKRLIGRGWTISFRLPPAEDRTNYTNGQVDREVIVNAATEPAAIRALDLIHAGLLLLEPDMKTAYFDFRLQPLSGP